MFYFRSLFKKKPTGLTEPFQPCLANKFNELVSPFSTDMEWLLNTPKDSLPQFTENLPTWSAGKIAPWKNLSPYYNCYNFALNCRVQRWLIPGDVADSTARIWGYNYIEEENPTKYLTAVLAGLQKDGVRPLKSSFRECANHEFPIALFFDPQQGEPDFHFMSLRHTKDNNGPAFVWAEKQGRCEPNIADHLFKVNQQRGYTHFAGFFAAPQTLKF